MPLFREFAPMVNSELFYYEAIRREKPGKFPLSGGDFQTASRNLYSLYSIAVHMNRRNCLKN